MADPQGAVVSDSTPLIYLAKIGRLDLLRDAFGEIHIPEAVFHEAVTQGKALKISDAYIIEKAIGAWIIKGRVEPEVDAELRFLDTNAKLSPGEKEALKLCRQLNATHFIADDREARRVSRILKIKPIGTIGILVQALRRGLIAEEEALQTLDDLVKAGFRISSAVYRRILDELGKRPPGQGQPTPPAHPTSTPHAMTADTDTENTEEETENLKQTLKEHEEKEEGKNIE